MNLPGDLAEEVLLLSCRVQGLLRTSQLIKHGLCRCLLNVSLGVSRRGLDWTQNLVLSLVEHSVTRVDRLVTTRERHGIIGPCNAITFVQGA
jgi:hypothetical protein